MKTPSELGGLLKSLESLSRGENGGNRNTEGCYSLEYLNHGAIKLLSACGGRTLRSHPSVPALYHFCDDLIQNVKK